MRRLTTVFLIISAIVAPLAAQQDRLETFQASFASSNLQTKLEILRAADGDDPATFGPLYGQALSFAVSNADSLSSEPLLREIALVAVNRIAAGRYEPAVNDLWRLFRSYDETTGRIQILNVLGDLAGANEQTIDFMNAWVETQNNLTSAGTRVDLQVLMAAVEALGRIGSASSFESVLDVILVQYPDFVTETALTALASLDGEPLELATDVIVRKSVSEKRAPFLFLIENDFLQDGDKLELARRTLANALLLRPQELVEQEEARQVRFAAAEVLRAGEYTEATGEVIRHFNETVLEFDRGRIPKNRLLEAIATLGAMGTPEAATRLTDYLELLNTFTEIDRPYDTQVLLAVITNLAILDSPSSYNALFFTTLLENYPRRVRDAAREAMESVSQ
ncbi:MAG: hypothetical protein MI724_01380 [Spirochaetales bacterium]|nr:hypothetical protein [Spirochaetales bacterium]